MATRLTEDFYRLPASEAAPQLLGKLLCRRTEDGHILRMRITETECYRGEDDTACHAHRGKTARNAPLYESGGIAYIYLCYGIHSLFNVITGEAGFPEGVLIRGAEGCSGPGRLTKALEITRALNRCDLVRSDLLWIEDDGTKVSYKAAPRVGIEYAAEKDRQRPWRFIADQPGRV